MNDEPENKPPQIIIYATGWKTRSPIAKGF
jgi:hypothetical protein